MMTMDNFREREVVADIVARNILALKRPISPARPQDDILAVVKEMTSDLCPQDARIITSAVRERLELEDYVPQVNFVLGSAAKLSRRTLD